MNAMRGGRRRGLVGLLAAAALAVGGCSSGMMGDKEVMGEKKMMDKEMSKDDMTKDKEMDKK